MSKVESQRINITLQCEEKAKLEQLSKQWGISQARVVGVLIRQAKLGDEPQSNLIRSEYEKLILAALANSKARKLQDIENILPHSRADSEVIAKEIAWKLVEEGKARWTSDWLLEYRPH